MLLLTRRPGETILIGGKVKVLVLKAGGSKVSLGITAPKSVRVDRAEIHQVRSNGAEREKTLPSAASVRSWGE